MKKIWCFLLACLLAACLAACGSNRPAASEAGNSSAAESSAQEMTEDTQQSEADPLSGTREDSSSAVGSTSTEETPSDAGADVSAGNETSAENSAQQVTDDTPLSEPASSAGNSSKPSSAAGSADTEAVSSQTNADTPEESKTSNEESGEETIMQQNTFYVNVGGETFSATFADNSGAQALKELLADGDITIRMRDYGGFEKVGSLGQSLPASNTQTTTQAGDIVLYQGNQIVMFYGSNSWSYTRLARIDDLTGWQTALGSGDVSVTFSLKGE